MRELKNYQEEAIVQLLTYSSMYFNLNGNETIVFQSPTGSGKTFMMSRYIMELSKTSEHDICFLWVSIGKGDLHKQSMKSVKREIDNVLTCSLLENDFFGSREIISQNEVVFVNWEKIRSKDKETGDFKNTLMKDKETYNFIEVLKNTRDTGRKIVLIIDESHSGATTSRAQEIRDEIIVPELTIEMSATPVLTSDMQARVTVDPTKVIQEGMIKKEILINPEIEKIVDDEIDSETLILESAYRKREELVKLYRDNGSNVNPLVLVQLPNSTAGEEKKESVTKFLESKGITEQNGKLAVWLSDEKINNEAEKLLDLDGSVEYLIFKQAIDTGWDCPRAQILVKFRETKSIVFEIQTVGRILRMPEAKHYMNDELNRAFVYTNIQSIAIKKEIYNPNILKSKSAKRIDTYTSTTLRSYYRNRVDYGDITASFYIVFEHEFCKFFGIHQVNRNESTDSYKNMEKLREKGVITEYGKTDSILNDVKIDSDKVDGYVTVDNQFTLINVGTSATDLEAKYDNLIKTNLNGFAPKRSIPTVKQAIVYAFKKYLGLESARGGIMYIQNMLVVNSNVFAEILNNATTTYKPIHAVEVNSKTDERFNDNWEIEPNKNYNPETTREFNSKLSLYQPLYMEIQSNGDINQLEKEFIKELDKHENKIDWFWKNGSEHMESNFGIQKEDKSTFQPDFIVKFKDGRIGIFDTKAGKGYNEEDNKFKSDSLYRYISEERYKGKNIMGGLVIFDGNQFKVYQKSNYKTYEEMPEKWDSFDNILNQSY